MPAALSSNPPSPVTTIRVSVAGASGYAGGELVRLLAGHPSVEIVHLAAGSHADKPLAEVFPSLGNLTGEAGRRLAGRELVDADFERLGADSDAVFLALPHGLSLGAVPALLDAGVKIVDLGGDFRLDDPAQFEVWYELQHSAPHLLDRSVYGMPEIYRDQIRESVLVANPGCYPTAATLALLPLAEAGLLGGGTVIVDAKSGVSGAGRKASLGFAYSEVNENLRAYGVFSHRHQPEMEQTLNAAALRSGVPTATRVRFVPHLVPMTRGILATCYATLSSDLDANRVAEIYRDRYATEPFVRFLENGAQPATKNVAGSNFCEVAVTVDSTGADSSSVTGSGAESGGPLVVATAAIDNLGKGAASAAIANFNLQWGLDERTGLEGLTVFP